MKRWGIVAADEVENPAIDAFLLEIVALCVKHDLSISHEDGHGAFEIEPYDTRNIEWLMAAHDATEPAE